MRDLFDLTGRIAIVTGALGQLGPVWIEALLAAGAEVAGVDHPDVVETEGFSALRMKYRGERPALYRADLRERAELIEVRDRLLRDVGVPWVLVNNAGVDTPPSPTAPRHRLEEIPLELFRHILDVNVAGTFQVIQIFGPLMVKAKRGSIINIGSLYATVAPDVRFYEHLGKDPPFVKAPAYGASKAAIVNLTKYLAALWGPEGVRVNTLSPGGVVGNQDSEFKRKFCERVPVGRMATAQDLVGPLLFLASDASSYVTGIDLQVDGGFTAW